MSDLSVASTVMSYEYLVSGGGSRSVSDTDDMQVCDYPLLFSPLDSVGILCQF